MKFTTAVFSFALLATPLAAQSPLPWTGPPVNPTTNPSGSTIAASVVDDFETYAVAVGAAEVIGVDTLDDTTIASGQGPGLVADGCTYTAGPGGSLQWNGSAYYGTASQNILSNTNGILTMLYDSATGDISFDLDAYVGFADTATITGYDDLGILVFTSAPITLPGGVPVPYSYSGTPVHEIRVTGSAFSWSPLVDNHAYGPGGPSLDIIGSCPGLVDIQVSNATPFGAVALAYGPAGSFTMAAGPCPGLTLDLAAPNLLILVGADVSGFFSLSVTAPAGACGISLQAVDLGACLTSAAVVL